MFFINYFIQICENKKLICFIYWDDEMFYPEESFTLMMLDPQEQLVFKWTDASQQFNVLAVS